MTGLECFFESEEISIRPPTRSRSPKLLKQVNAANHNRHKLSQSYDHVPNPREEPLLTFGRDDLETPRFDTQNKVEFTRNPLMPFPKRIPFVKVGPTRLGMKAGEPTSNYLIGFFKDSPKLKSLTFNEQESQLAAILLLTDQNTNRQDRDKVFDKIPSQNEEMLEKKLNWLKKQKWSGSIKFRPLSRGQNEYRVSIQSPDIIQATASRHISVRPKGVRYPSSMSSFKRSNSFLKFSSKVCSDKETDPLTYVRKGSVSSKLLQRISMKPPVVK